MSPWAYARNAFRTLFERFALIVFCLGAGQSYKDGKYQQAFASASAAYELALKLYGEDDHLVGVRLNMLGILYEEAGELDAAEQCFRRSLEIVRVSRGEAHREYASALEKLASLHRMRAEHGEADRLYRQALAIKRKFYGKNNRSVAHTLNSLALLCEEAGRYSEAEELFKELLAMHDEIFPRRYTREGATARATALNNLAVLYEDLGDLSRAETCYTKSLLIHRNSYGKKHPAITRTVNNFAYFYLRSGNYQRAEELATESLAISLKAFGELHPLVASSRKILGSVLERRGDLRGAELCYLKALEIHRQAYGDKHPRGADDLNSLGLLYIRMCRFDEADANLREALDICQTAWGERHRSLYPIMNNRALLYCHLGRYEEAERVYLEALDLLGGLVGEDHEDYATCQENLAEVYLLCGRYDEAHELLKRALGIQRRARGQDDTMAGSVLNKLGLLSIQRGRYAEAEAHLQEARSLLHKRYGDAMSVQVESNLAAVYLKVGKYAEAEELFRETLRVKLSIWGEKHPAVALDLNNLANLYSGIGDFEKSRSYLSQAIEIMTEAYGGQHPSLATALYNLGLLHYFEGQYDKAAEHCARALEMRLSTLGEEHPSYGESLNGRGMIAHCRGDYAGAEADFQNAQRVLTHALGPEHPDVVVVLHNLAGLYADLGRFEDARPLFEQLLRLMPKALGDQHPHMTAFLNTAAMCSASAGRADEALALMERAAAVEDQTIGQVMSLGSDRQRLSYLAEQHINLSAFLSLVLQHFPHSTEAKRKAYDLVLRRKGLGVEALAAQRDAVLSGRYPELAEPLHRLRELQSQIAEQALPDLRGAGTEDHAPTLALLETERDGLEAELARRIPDIKLIRQLHRANSRIISHALPEGCLLVDFVHFDDFNYAAIPARGESRLRASGYLAFILGAKAPDSLQVIHLGNADTINRLIASFTLAITSEPGADAELTYEREAEVRAPQRTSSAQPETARDAAGASTRRLDFYDPTQEEEQQQPSVSSLREIGVELRRLVFDPLLGADAGRPRLLLSPEGDLTRLPFEVLPLDDGRYVIDEFEVSYLSTGRDALRLTAHPGAPPSGWAGPPLVAAAPDFDLSVTPAVYPHAAAETEAASEESAGARAPGETSRNLPRGRRLFDPLPKTKLEGELIAQRLHVWPLLGDQVLKRHLRERRFPSILHIATHGFFLPDQPEVSAAVNLNSGSRGTAHGGEFHRLPAGAAENPLLRSGLALAGANTWLLGGPLPPEAENGILTALDVSGLDLLDTELVVLSACVTGLGAIRVGEGVFGLRRAVELAGARTLVMSLWKVPDHETQILMDEFYRQVVAGRPRASALRDAQLMVKDRYAAHPYFWGAFVCNGDPGPLPPEMLRRLNEMEE